MAEDLNGKYVRQDVFDQIMKRMDDKFDSINGKLDDIQVALKKNGNGKLNMKFYVILAVIMVGSTSAGAGIIPKLLELLK